MVFLIIKIVHTHRSRKNKCVKMIEAINSCLLVIIVFKGCMLVLAQAAKTENHRMGDLNNRNLFSHSFGDWKYEIRLPAWSSYGKSSLPGL